MQTRLPKCVNMYIKVNCPNSKDRTFDVYCAFNSDAKITNIFNPKYFILFFIETLILFSPFSERIGSKTVILTKFLFQNNFSDVMAMFGVLGNAGIQASSAGTTLRMMYQNLMQPNKNQKATLKKYGITARDASVDPLEMIEILA